MYQHFKNPLSAMERFHRFHEGDGVSVAIQGPGCTPLDIGPGASTTTEMYFGMMHIHHRLEMN